MSKLPKGVQAVLGVLAGIGVFVGCTMIIVVGLFHQPFPGEWVGRGILGGLFGILFVQARTHPRVNAAIRAGLWAALVAGIAWITTALIYIALINPLFGWEVNIPPLIVWVIATVGLYRWFEQHPFGVLGSESS